MKMKILALLAVLFIACSALHLVESSNAAPTKKGYLIDHGTIYGIDDEEHSYKCVWKTYWYSKNTRKVVRHFYCYGGRNYQENLILEKVSKNKMKVRWDYIDYDSHSFDVFYVKTKLSTRAFYWKIVKPRIEDYPSTQ